MWYKQDVAWDDEYCCICDTDNHYIGYADEAKKIIAIILRDVKMMRNYCKALENIQCFILYNYIFPVIYIDKYVKNRR